MNAKEVGRLFRRRGVSARLPLERKPGPEPAGEIIDRHPSRREPLLGFSRADQVVVVSKLLGGGLQCLFIDVVAGRFGRRQRTGFSKVGVEETSRRRPANRIVDRMNGRRRRLRSPCCQEQRRGAEARARFRTTLAHEYENTNICGRGRIVLDIGRQVRKIYERRPYPPPAMRVATGVGLPAEWIAAMTGRPFHPRRVLVAGCGVGVEAFALAERYPEANVVGVDFSPRAIAEARRLQRKAGARKRMRFEVADLAGSGLEKIAGVEFDVVSCHGVLSYIPDTAAALRNIAGCMSSDGVLMLGVNGAGHLSVRYRAVLREFDYDVDQFRESEDVRELLRVCDTLSVYPPVRIADFDAGYLAGDIFGPLNIALTVGGWNTLLEKGGLHLASTFRAFYATREVINRGLHAVLLPRTRAEVAGIVDVLHPSSFHQLLVTRDVPPAPPFARPERLMKRKPAVTELYKIRKPRKGRRWSDLRDVALRSPSTNTSVDLTIPEWEVEILRRADGSRTLGSILGEVRPAVSPSELGDALYLLYLLGVLNP